MLDDQLHSLVQRIEQSHISRDEKEQLYDTIRVALHHAVMPVLVAHMPKNELEKLVSNLDTVTPKAYFQLVKEAFRSPGAIGELDSLMQKMLQAAEEALKNKLVISA